MDANTPNAASRRWLALDVFRALAVVWMIQGHTFTALMQPERGTSGAARLYALLHGLTAPMFLLGAGLAYGVVRIATASRPSGRILRRALTLLAIGTLLQLPAAPLHSLFMRRDLLVATLSPGVLQLVAACLLVAEMLRTATRTRLAFVIASGTLAVGLTLLAPFIWQRESSRSLVLGGWLDGQAGSQFPFVPWACFFLLGAALAGAGGRSLWTARWIMPLIGAFGVLGSAGCYVLFATGERLTSWYGAHAFWYSNPMFVVFRAGLVCAWLGTLSSSEQLIARLFALFPRFGVLMTALARHSLVAYVAHLVLLYGTPLTPGLARGATNAGFLATTAVFGLVLAATIACVLIFARWETWRFNPTHPPVAREPGAPRW